MAACNLTIELDEPSRARTGGEPISGVVLVATEKEVQCKALTVTSRWATHGSGNIAQGEVETKTLFLGSWQPGQPYRYPFALSTAIWPPTYYGQHLNVSHSVKANADIPWAIDASTMQEFPVIATETPENLAPTDNAVKAKNWVGWLIGILLLGGLFASIIPLALIVAPLVAIGYVVYWLFSTFLPRQVTGEVIYQVEPATLTQGEMIRGTCEFTPKRSSTINGITWMIQCAEVCTSGSGSNRKTHTHEVLKKTQQLREPGLLQAGQVHKYDFSFEVPTSVPPTMTLSDNKIIWTSELRIDIPKWPDWARTTPFVVKVLPSQLTGPTSSSNRLVATVVEDDEPWLTEVLQQVVQSQEDPERLVMVLEAVKDQAFPLTVDIQGEAEEPFEVDIDDEGSWVSAIDTRRKTRLTLFVPASIDATQIQWTTDWQCVGSIVGFESETDRVVMKVFIPKK